MVLRADVVLMPIVEQSHRSLAGYSFHGIDNDEGWVIGNCGCSQKDIKISVNISSQSILSIPRKRWILSAFLFCFGFFNRYLPLTVLMLFVMENCVCSVFSVCPKLQFIHFASCLARNARVYLKNYQSCIHGVVGADPNEGHEDDQRVGALLL